MKQLKIVKQLDQHGCSIACLAMVTGKPYFKIREIIHTNINRMGHGFVQPDAIGLGMSETIDLLAYKFNIQSKRIKFISLDKLTNHCILIMSYKTYNHEVIFDAVSRCILDPLGKTIDLSKYKVTDCIELRWETSLRTNPIQWIFNLIKSVIRRKNHV